MRVGFVLAGIFTGSSIALWPSVAQLFPNDGKDTLVIFPGGKLNSPSSLEQMKNSLYDLVNEDNLDGTIIWSSSLAGSVDATAVLKRFEGLLSKPLVTIDGKSSSYPKIPNICFDAYEGSKYLVQHCITVHGAKRILYLRGPLNHNSSMKRYEAYVDTLVENGIPVDPKLISEPTEWSQGGEGLKNMLETRNLRPGRDFDMIICASDLMMYEAEQVLKAYGYSVGENVFICGFNDSIDSRLLRVPATTVRLPYSGVGRNSVTSLLSLAQGKRCYDKLLATTPIIRRSCGCESFQFSSEISNASELVSHLVRDFAFTAKEAKEMINQVSKKPNEAAIRYMLDKLYSMGADNHELIKVINGFKSILSPEKFSALALISYALVPSFLDNRMSRLSFEERNTRRIFNAFNNQLLETSNFQEIVEVLNKNASDLGFSKIYLVYNDGGKSFLIRKEGSEPIEFAEKMLVPASNRPLLESGVWIATPLCSETEYMGYLLMKAVKYDGFTCEEVRGAVSSAIKNARLFETARKAQKTAEAAELSRTHFFANITENLRSPLTEISDMVLNSKLEEQARKEINNRIVDVKRTIDLSLISTGELELSCSYVRVSEVLKDFTCYSNEENSEEILDGVLLDEKRFKKVLEIIVSELEASGSEAQMMACRTKNGVKISISDKNGFWQYSESSSLDYAKQIVLLHNGNFCIEDHGISITLPYPTENSSLDTKGKVLLQVGTLSEQLHRWLQDPEIINCDFTNILSAFRRYKPNLVIFTLEQYENDEQTEQKLLRALHGIRSKALTPVIICSDYISATLIQEMGSLPNTLFVNSCILESDEFAMRVRALLGGAELLSPLTGQIVKKAQLYLCQHSTLPISRWQVADEVHTSEDYLTRIFKKELGLSPWDYLSRYRVWLAENLLRNTGMSVNEVSRETGFQDQAYFCRVFKKIKGYSPIKVKKR